jgi:hypothetical protein
MTDYQPFTKTFSADTIAVAAGSDATVNICAAPFAGKITGVRYAPNAVLTGANTDSRTLSIINKGQAGSGTTTMASKAFTSGVNAPASDETAITLSVTAADLIVAAGDIIAFKSTHVGSTGLADPGGLIEVDFVQAQA